MSTTEDDDTDPDLSRDHEEKLKALIRKDVDDRVTELARRALKRYQEDSS
jgi:hypothetical protein